MEEFLAIAFGFPTVVFTVLGLTSIAYWLLVMLGLLDMDALGSADGLGGAEGLDGAELDVGDAGAEAGDGPADGSALAALLSALRLRHVPVTLSLSLITLFAWLASYFAARHLAPVLPLPSGMSQLLVLVGALALAIPITSVITRPLGGLFRATPATKSDDLIGKVGVIRIGASKGGTAQAAVKDGGAGLLLRVRCEVDDGLSSGREVLFIGYDAATGEYEVEPVSDVLGERRS